jgi:hypothetical protein
MPGGTVPATNKKFGVFFAQLIETTEDGRGVQRERTYLDVGSLLGQLGLSPAPHRKLVEKGWAEKPVVIATGNEVEKANLAGLPSGIEAFNEHDLPAMLGLFADDVVLSSASAPADVVGRAAVRKSYQELFKGFPDAKLELTTSWAAGDYVVSEGVFSGTNSRALPSWGIKKATGKPVRSRYTEIAKLEAGTIKNAWIFDNGMAFATQLGLAPSPVAKPTEPSAPAGAPAKSAR